MDNKKSKSGRPLDTSETTEGESVEFTTINQNRNRKGTLTGEKNFIYFVSVGRIADKRILISALTNKWVEAQ